MTTRPAYRRLRIILGIVTAPFFVLSIGWAAAALVIDGPVAPMLAKVLAGGFSALRRRRSGVRPAVPPRRRGRRRALGARARVVARHSGPEHRDWQPDVARTAHVTADGDRVTIQNVRNFEYRSESDYAGPPTPW